jgi:hypothetical protein
MPEAAAGDGAPETPAVTSGDDATPAPVTQPAPETAATPSRPAKPVTDVLADRLGRHRLWTVTLHLERKGRVVAPETVEKVKKFIKDNVLDTLLFDTAKGVVVVRATKHGLEQAFSAKDARRRTEANPIRMVVVVVDGVRYRTIEGELVLPPGVRKVTGFDTRPEPPRRARKGAPQAPDPGGKSLG